MLASFPANTDCLARMHRQRGILLSVLARALSFRKIFFFHAAASVLLQGGCFCCVMQARCAARDHVRGEPSGRAPLAVFSSDAARAACTSHFACASQRGRPRRTGTESSTAHHAQRACGVDLSRVEIRFFGRWLFAFFFVYICRAS